jgi:cation diffusion facilitator CzcD-associated flavoprotein CzcO
VSGFSDDGAPSVERHEAIVAGGGPAGLAVAALLRRRGFETLVLERTAAVGASWRTRYAGLRLNTLRRFSALPGHRIPRCYGRYPRREDFVAYLETYAAQHRLVVRFGTALERIDRAEDEGLWQLDTSNGSLLARYVIVATGYDAAPRLPAWAVSDGFAGELIHASEYRSPQPYCGREVLVVGAGNTGIDIAGFLVKAGARVSLAMRSPPNLFPREWRGFPLQPPTILDRLPATIGDTLGFLSQRLIYGDLSPYGIPRSPEGLQTKYRRHLVAPAVDDGFIAALKAGQTQVVSSVERLEGADVVLTDGRRLRPEAVICATGYDRGLEPIAGHLGVLRPDGVPIHFHGAPEHPDVPRLYFAGFHAPPSGQLRTMPTHARRITRAAVRDRKQSR